MRQILKQVICFTVCGVSSFFFSSHSGGALNAQELVLGGGFMGAQKQKEPEPNPLIKTSWGKSVDGMSLRIGEGVKKRWGLAEIPTFLLKLKNETDQQREIVVSSADLTLRIDDKKYVWNAPDTKLVSTIKPRQTKASFFILRFEPAQWKLATENSQAKSEDRLNSLQPGKKKFEVQLRLGESQIVSSEEIEFEISKNAFELPSVQGVLLGLDGKPVEGADIYLCSDAQFSVYYSGFNGKWFSSKNVSHYDPFGGFSRAIKPLKTKKDGLFSLSPGMRHKRIVVLPPVGSAQVFELPNSYTSWKVKLRETGSIILEQDIPGETSTVNSSFSTSRRFAVHPQQPNRALMMTENFNMPLTNGKKYELKHLMPGTYSLNRYKYVRVGNRSYSVGRMSRQFDLGAGQNLEYRMVRKSGQKISVTATKIPSNSQYIVASVFAMDQPINTNSIYSNDTIWSNAAPNPNKEADFKSCLISPGKYRVVVMSVPEGKNPNSYTYKPNMIGSKIIEVGEKGELSVGKIQLYPVDVWRRNSGMALEVKLVNQEGNAMASRYLWPVYKGYLNFLITTAPRTDGAGKATLSQPAGEYSFAAGLDKNQPIFFNVRVPRMTPKTIVLPEPPAWGSEEAKKVQLEVTAKFISTGGRKVEFTVHNKGENSFKPRFGDLQVVGQVQAINKSSGVRFLPNQESSIYEMEFKPKTKKTVSIDWDQLTTEGLCTSVRLSTFSFTIIKPMPSESKLFFKVKLGPVVSKEFEAPELPRQQPKPFR